MIISTAAASGKSLGYLLPALTAVLAGDTVLYVTPTKALAADQLRSIRALGLPGVQAAVFDGDSTRAERDWARSHARYLLTTPDMLHRALLPRHNRWSGFFSRLSYVVVDECHGYRGVFGSHVAHVLRRLRRVVAHHAPADGDGRPRPVFVLASATVGAPGACARLLTGLDAEEITEDGSPRGPLAFALWEPPLTESRGEAGARLRRTATAQAADLLGRLVRENVQTLAFIRSRRGAEAVALAARRSLESSAGGSAGKVAAYRSGYLPEDRRRLEAALSDGSLVGLATTTALELGVNITGLDAVLIAGWPGTFSALWQQAGRAGRSGQAAAAVLIARDDPLDTYLVRHPEMLLRHPVEATVMDPDNPYVLRPHLCAAATELALTEQDLDIFGPAARTAVDELTRAGRLRRRPAGWFSMRRDAAAALGLRGAGLAPIRVVEQATGRLVGTVDEPSAHLIVHEGAVYVHQGDSYLVQTLDLADRVALVEPGEPGYTTTAKTATEVEIRGELRTAAWGPAEVRFGDVQVTRQVVSFTQRCADTGALLGEVPLDLPPRHLVTRAVWWTLSEEAADALAERGHRPGRRGARGRARLDRAAALVRHVRSLGHRRGLRGQASGHREAHRLRLRRARRRRRVRRARLRRRRGLAPRHQAGHRRLRLRGRLPLLRAVAEVRERQPPAVQARSGRPAGHAAGRRRAGRHGAGRRELRLGLRPCRRSGSRRCRRNRRRAPPGGRAAPARTVRPWGGRPTPSYLIRIAAKCPRMRPPVSVSRRLVVNPQQVLVAA